MTACVRIRCVPRLHVVVEEIHFELCLVNVAWKSTNICWKELRDARDNVFIYAPRHQKPKGNWNVLARTPRRL